MIWGDLAELEPRASLEWDRGALAADCERATVVRQGVETYLGRAVFVADGAIVVRVRLELVNDAGGPHVVAHVSQRDASGKSWGERTVSGGPDCASLDEPLTLVVALMVDEPAASRPSPAPSMPEHAPPPTPPTPEPPRGAIETAPSLERELQAPAHAVVLGWGSAWLGVLPRLAGGVGMAASFKPRGSWGFGVEAELVPAVREPVGAGQLTASLMLARATVCPLQGMDDHLWWSACASLGGARLSIQSHDLVDARRRRDWFLMPGAGVRAGWRWSRQWMLVGGLSTAFPLSPDRYVYRDDRGEKHDAFTMAQLGISLSVGVGALFD